MKFKQTIIARGAEAVLIKNCNYLLKRRIPKSYRLLVLDERLRKQRTKKEAKLLEKAYKLIPIPKIIKVNEKTKEIEMEFIEGKKLSENLEKINYEKICLQIGNNLAKLHDHEIIHGDLTTSNMIFEEKTNLLYFIDFGLGFISKKIEDKAVDLHLIKEALEAKHFSIAKISFERILEGYKISKYYKEVLQRLKKVELRGRYKAQY